MIHRRMIPIYSPDGTSLGFRTLDAALRLVAGGYVRPAYGRKGHIKAIWLLKEDGGSPVQSRARTGTRYSYIEALDNGRCWQLRRLDRCISTAGGTASDSANNTAAPVSPRDPFLQVIRECMSPSPDAQRTTTLAPPRWCPHERQGYAATSIPHAPALSLRVSHYWQMTPSDFDSLATLSESMNMFWFPPHRDRRRG
jgi:hypothetical protein